MNILRIIVSAMILAVVAPKLSQAQAFEWHSLAGPQVKDSTGTLVSAGYLTSLVATDSYHLLAASASHGVFLSTDRGESWRHVYVFDGTNYLFKLTATKEGLVAGATAKGMLFSSDHGETWELRGFASLKDTIDQVVFGFDGGILAHRKERGAPPLVRSTDGGHMWSDIDTLMPMRISIGRTNTGILLASTIEREAIVGVGAFWSSLDNGRTWVRHNLPSYIGYSHEILVSPTDEVLIASYEDDGVYITGNNNFDHWRTIVEPAYHTSIENYGFFNGCLVALDNYLLQSCDGVHWDTIGGNSFSGAFVVEAFNTLFSIQYYGLVRLDADASVAQEAAAIVPIALTRSAVTCAKADEVLIIDHLGRTLYTFSNVQGERILPCPLSPGLYIVRSTSKGRSTIVKVAIQ